MNSRQSKTENYKELMRHTDDPVPWEPEPKPVCTVHPHCEGCPYPGHGFVCWNNEERCLRKTVNRLNGIK